MFVSEEDGEGEGIESKVSTARSVVHHSLVYLVGTDDEIASASHSSKRVLAAYSLAFACQAASYPFFLVIDKAMSVAQEDYHGYPFLAFTGAVFFIDAIVRIYGDELCSGGIVGKARDLVGCLARTFSTKV